MESLARHRAWIVMGVVLIVAVLAVTLGKRTRNGTVHSGGGAPRVGFGPQVQKPGATSRLIYTNGWEATSAERRIGVYAGRESSSPRNGLLVILRQTHDGNRRLTSVVVRGSGAVTLLRPARPASEQQAFTETLHFVTADGATGTLDLSSDRVSVNG